jgi:hypothetical protein
MKKKLAYWIFIFISVISYGQNGTRMEYGYAFKIQPLDMAKYHLSFGLEKQITKFKSISLMVGIIGVSKVPLEFYQLKSASGNYIVFGYKSIISKPKLEFRGLYTCPEIGYGFAKETVLNSNNSKPSLLQNNTQFFSLTYNLGVTGVIKKHFLLDIYFGLGICFDDRSRKHDYQNESNNYYISKINAESRLAYRWGIGIGYVFNNPNK